MYYIDIYLSEAIKLKDNNTYIWELLLMEPYLTQPRLMPISPKIVRSQVYCNI